MRAWACKSHSACVQPIVAIVRRLDIRRWGDRAAAFVSGLGVVERKVRITNTSGRILAAGTRVYWSRSRRAVGINILWHTTLKYDLKPGLSITRKVQVAFSGCSAHTYLRITA